MAGFSPAQEAREVVIAEINATKLQNTGSTTTTFGFRPKFACTLTEIELHVNDTTAATDTIQAEVIDGALASGSVMLDVSSTAEQTFVSDVDPATTGAYATFVPRNGECSIVLTTTAANQIVQGLHVAVIGKAYPNADS